MRRQQPLFVFLLWQLGDNLPPLLFSGHKAHLTLALVSTPAAWNALYFLLACGTAGTVSALLSGSIACSIQLCRHVAVLMCLHLPTLLPPLYALYHHVFVEPALLGDMHVSYETGKLPEGCPPAQSPPPEGPTHYWSLPRRHDALCHLSDWVWSKH
jgi:hypothetical protein